MAKDNLFLGMARGKVGDVVFSRLNGVQVSRARNRSPKNPQTPLQLLQRVVLKTVSGAYSLFQPIADHSFQGSAQGTPNQSRFIRKNVEILRNRLAEEINSGSAEEIMWSEKTNFATKGSSLAEFNAYQVSEGSITPVSVVWDGTSFALQLPNLPAGVSAPTYQNIVDALGIQQGDQLTFLMLSSDDTDMDTTLTSKFGGFVYARVILEPSNGDMTSAFLSGTSVANPNARNEGDVNITFVATGDAGARLQFITPAFSNSNALVNSIGGATVIVSRLVGSAWQRSTQSITLRPDGMETGSFSFNHNMDMLGDAVQSFMAAENSSLYLNQSRSF